MSKIRVVCLNCIDGRIQIPAINWIKQHYDIDFVDMITEPGMDGFLANKETSLEDIKRKLKVSISNNKAKMIVVVAHDDCRGNPVSEAEHRREIQEGAARIKQEFQDLTVIGLWLNSNFEGELIEV